MIRSEWEATRLLKQYDDVELPMDARFYERLHDKIMARVDEVDSYQPNRIARMRASLQAHWKSWFYLTETRR